MNQFLLARQLTSTVVKRHHPQEFSECASCVRVGESRNRLHFQREKGGPIFVDEMPREVDGGQPEQALRRVDDQSVLVESHEEVA